MSSEYVNISDELVKNLQLALTFPVHGLTAVAGVVSNLLIMIILSRLGLKNSMWVGVFALSVTDFIVTSLQIAKCCCYVLTYVYPESNVDMWMLGAIALGLPRYSGFYVSMWITTVIAVERCFCVVSPFKVKRVFTRRRCVFAVVVIYTVYVSLILPVYIVEKIDWLDVPHEENNVTAVKRKILTVVLSQESIEVEIIIDTIGAVALSITSQIILLVCSVWMTYAMRASSEVRRSKDVSTAPNRSPHQSELSVRERKLIKVVMCMAWVLTICNIPRYAVLAVHLLIPGMASGLYKNVGVFMWDISDFFSTINCSSNFFVYWMLNGNFRNGCKQLFQSAVRK